MRYEVPISTLPYFISNGFENIVSSSTSNKILALSLLNLSDILIKVFNMSFYRDLMIYLENYHLKDYL